MGKQEWHNNGVRRDGMEMLENLPQFIKSCKIKKSILNCEQIFASV